VDPGGGPLVFVGRVVAAAASIGFASFIVSVVDSFARPMVPGDEVEPGDLDRRHLRRHRLVRVRGLFAGPIILGMAGIPVEELVHEDSHG
jgi:hypothetical protein